MQENIPAVYGLWGGLVLLLLLQSLWTLFFAYPAGFERALRRGRGWVYVPLHWKGFRKLRILLPSRLLLLGIATIITLLLVHYFEKKQTLWIAAFVAVGYAAASWAQEFWNGLRYRQQEDAYFLLHDELRAKFERENKDYSTAQLRNLAAYQHQQRLRKADEEGEFLAILRGEARRFRQARPAALTHAAEA